MEKTRRQTFRGCLLFRKVTDKLIHLFCVCAHFFSRVDSFVTPQTISQQALLSMEFSRQEYWSGLPLPSPGGLLHPGTELASPASPASAGEVFSAEPPGKAMSITQFSSVQSLSLSVVSDSLRPHESQPTRPLCPSPTPGVYPITFILIVNCLWLPW